MKIVDEGAVPLKYFAFFALSVVAFGCSALSGPSPYAMESVPQTAVSVSGRFMASLTYGGEIRVYDLFHREMVFSPPRGRMPGIPGGQEFNMVAFRGSTEEVIWDCAYGKVCYRDLATGESGVLVEHDPQDNVVLAVSSDDGMRLAFGTVLGRVFTFTIKSGKQETKKPRDVWTPIRPWAIYTLEAQPSLGHFVSSTVVSSPSHESCTEADDPIKKVRGSDGSLGLAICFEGVTIWPWRGLPVVADDGFADNVRADFSSDGRKLFINEQNARIARLYTIDGKVSLARSFAEWSFTSSEGVRFLDTNGQYIGIVSDGSMNLSVFDLESETDERGRFVPIELKLKNRPASGPRVLAALPEKGWIFVGTRKAAVDWYKVTLEPEPRLEHIATLD